MYDVIIIGAGPAGLTTAYTLLSKSPEKKVLVLESDAHYVGGISRTVEHNGYRFDIGGHRFFSKSQRIVDLWREILPDDFMERPRLSRIFYRSNFFTYPLKAFESFAKLGPLTSLQCVLSYAYARIFPLRPAKTYHAWVRNHFGEKLFRIFFKTYTEKVWGMDCDEISSDWAAQRIKGLNLSAAIIDALRTSLRLNGLSRRKGAVIKTLIPSFQYPRLGPGMMWEAAARKICSHGGEIRMAHAVTGLRKTSRGWCIEATTPDGKKEFESAHVVSSAPLRDLVGAITPLPAAAAKSLRYRDFITVALMLSHEPAFKDNWIYIHDPSVKVGRIQNFTSWSPHLVPQTGKGCLGLEYFCTEDDSFWRMSDADLIAMARREVEKIGLISGIDITDAHIVRQPKAYPVYDQDYRATLDSIMTELATDYPGLHLVGRNGMHRYNNQDHAMMTGILTAENIIAGRAVYDVRNVNEDAEYHEDIRTDDKETKATA